MRVKTIYSKGKLFGRIDVAAFLILLLILASVAVGIKFFLRKEKWIEVEIKGGPGNWWWVTPAPPYWLANAVEKGDVEVDYRGRVIAEIFDFRAYKTGEATTDFYIKARLNVKFDKTSGRFRYKGEPVEVGVPITLETATALITGNIIWVEGREEGERVEKVVKLKLYEKYPWEAEAIAVGDTMTDGEGDIVAKILDKRVERAEITVETDRGDVLARRDPLKRDITLDVKLVTIKYGDELLFRKDQIVKVGKKLLIQTPHYDFEDAYVINIMD